MATKEERENEVGRILGRDGSIRASVLLKESTPKAAPLHDEFLWRDKEAAHQYRLSQSRRIVRTTPVRSEAGVECRLTHVPVATVSGPTASTQEREGEYKLISDVVKNDDEYHRCIRQLQNQVSSMESTIRELKRQAGEQSSSLLPTLEDAMQVARSTVSLMLDEAA
jgi:hypothetical protein